MNGPAEAAPTQSPDAAASAPLLEVTGLSVMLETKGAKRPVLRDVSLTVRPGEALGLVGESGSGKTMTARAIGRLLPPGAEVHGSIRFGGTDIRRLAGAQLRQYRSQVAMIFQDPRAHINPVRRIGDFMTEALRANLRLPAAQAQRRAANALAQVGIEDAARRLRQYPHQMSGGMLQRVMIAAALLTGPRLLLADEPTTALDVTTQAEVMAILDDLRREVGLGMLFITHDLDLAAAICDRTAVMYAGQIVEVRTLRPAAQRPAAPLHRGARRRPAGHHAGSTPAARHSRAAAVRARGTARGVRLRAAMCPRQECVWHRHARSRRTRRRAQPVRPRPRATRPASPGIRCLTAAARRSWRQPGCARSTTSSSPSTMSPSSFSQAARLPSPGSPVQGRPRSRG